MEEYFKILLGGLFGIATIVVAVMSLASNIINGKFLNMYVNKMFRFNILFTFIPIYYVVGYCILIMKWSWLANNEWAILIGISGFLIITTYCSYLTAQYVIDTERFQKNILKASISNLKKKLEDENSDSLIVDYMIEANRNINCGDCRIFQDTNSREELYKKYLSLINVSKIDDENMLNILNVLVSEFDVNKAFEMCSNFRIGQLTYILLCSIDQNTDTDTMNLCIRRIHAYFLYSPLSDGPRYERYKEIVVYNKKLMIESQRYLELTLQYLTETKFVTKDAFYLSNIIRQIYDIEDLIMIKDLKLEKNIEELANKLINAKKDYIWENNETERDQAIQTALIMIEGGKNEERNI